MRRGIVLLHGLPGVGKSTLARELANRQSDFFYADLARHPDFRTKSMFSLCAELYDSEGQGRSLITEGVMSRTLYRDRLVAKLIQHAAERKTAFEFAIIINLVADLTMLTSRRNRSLADYERLAAGVEVGSNRFPYRTLEAATSSTQFPNENIERLTAIVEECQSKGGTLACHGAR